MQKSEQILLKLGGLQLQIQDLPWLVCLTYLHVVLLLQEWVVPQVFSYEKT